VGNCFSSCGEVLYQFSNLLTYLVTKKLQTCSLILQVSKKVGYFPNQQSADMPDIRYWSR